MDVKVGDEVLVETRWSKGITAVIKVTPKGYIRTSNGGYYNSDGYEKSTDPWCGSRITLLTEDKKEELAREKTIKYVLKLMHDTKDLTYEKAIKIKEILEQEE